MRQVSSHSGRNGKRGPAGLAFSAVALLCHLLGTLLLPLSALAQTADGPPVIAGAICLAGGAGSPGPDQPPSHHSVDCALCPVCLVASLPVLSPAPPVVPARAWVAQARVLPPTRAGPPRELARPAAQARAPPATV